MELMMTSKVDGYNCFPGTGYRTYGRLVVNFHRDRAVSIYFDGVCIWAARENAWEN